MTPEQFAYWLQGFSELTDKKPSEKQWEMIKEHLQTVFVKETKITLNSQPQPQFLCNLETGKGLQPSLDLFSTSITC